MQQNCSNSRDEINLMDYWNVIRKRKKLIVIMVGLVTVITAIVSLTMPKYYKAEAVIMPIGGGGGGALAALTGQFGGLASLAGVSGIAGQTPSQQMMVLLGSKTLADKIIDKCNLTSVLSGNANKRELDKTQISADDQDDTSKLTSPKEPMTEGVSGALFSYVRFVDNKKEGTIKIIAEFKDPRLAAEVANGYVEGLQKFISENALTVAKRNRIFVEGQLEENKKELLEAGKDLNEFYKEGRVSSVDSKINVPLINNTNHSLKNHDDDQLDVLENQKAKIESKLLVEDVPQQVYLQYLTLRRNLLTQINTLLTQQYEMAKIEEAKEDLMFQVIDPARIPEKRSKPNKRKMVMVSFAASLFVGVFVTFVLEFLEKMKKQINV